MLGPLCYFCEKEKDKEEMFEIINTPLPVLKVIIDGFIEEYYSASSKEIK